MNFPQPEKCHVIKSNIDLWTTASHTLLRIKKTNAELHSIIHQTA